MANQESKKTSGRGGWRGGGRPVTALKQPLMVRISQEAMDLLNEHAKNKSEYIDDVIKRDLGG
ncbi:MAG: hypothetical protein J6X07_08865 [Prevotella sp.]|nr:hypothetical protein [Prevotella sp.]